MNIKRLLGFGIIDLIPFSDEDFTLDTPNKYTIQLQQQDAEDEAMMELPKEFETLVRANGAKDVYTKPNKKSAMASFSVINPIDDELLALMYPDSQKIIDAVLATKTKIEFYDQIGLLLSEWQNAVKMIFKPVDADENALAAKYWVTFPRAVLVPALKGSASAKPGKTKLEIISIGGRDTSNVRVPLVIVGDETATP